MGRHERNRDKGHGHDGHRSKGAPIGMVRQRASLAERLAALVVVMFVLGLLAVGVWLLFR